MLIIVIHLYGWILFARWSSSRITVQFLEFLASMKGVALVDTNDRWVWSLEGSGEFSVASVRRLIDERWLHGMNIDSILCHICDKTVESASHIFFACHIAREVFHKITSWWDVKFMEVSSYEEWLE
ncbi:RNA-directed DNA polymerase, eukaryota [Tanacetum coccineum]